MREEACRGVDSPGFVTPPCRDPELRPEQFQELGINSAATHPPTYYAVTGWAARVVDELPRCEQLPGRRAGDRRAAGSLPDWC